jgi:hypothetical protein
VQRGRGGPLTGAGRAVSRAGGEATQPPWACLSRPPSHEGRGRGIRSLGCGGVSLNTMRPGVALASGSGSHLPGAVPGAPNSRPPPTCFTYAKTRRIFPAVYSCLELQHPAAWGGPRASVERQRK